MQIYNAVTIEDFNLMNIFFLEGPGETTSWLICLPAYIDRPKSGSDVPLENCGGGCRGVCEQRKVVHSIGRSIVESRNVEENGAIKVSQKSTETWPAVGLSHTSP